MQQFVHPSVCPAVCIVQYDLFFSETASGEMRTPHIQFPVHVPPTIILVSRSLLCFIPLTICLVSFWFSYLTVSFTFLHFISVSIFVFLGFVFYYFSFLFLVILPFHSLFFYLLLASISLSFFIASLFFFSTYFSVFVSFLPLFIPFLFFFLSEFTFPLCLTFFIKPSRCLYLFVHSLYCCFSLCS